MTALQRAVEWLRPFVETMGWDYVVVWKLGDDPSQFFEWVGCCCSVCGNAKEKRMTKRQKKMMMMNPSAPVCRDGYFVHPVKTVACQALSEFPTSMPLYSGIHGDVVTTNQFKWLWISPGTSSSNSESSSLTELAGTRVLIPVVGGVVELFNSKYIPEERKIVDFMMAQCEFFWKQETDELGSCTGMDLKEQVLSNCLRKCSVTSIPKCIRSTCEEVSPHIVSCAHQSFEGSSSSSNPSSEQTSLGSCSKYVVQGGPLKQFPRESLVIDHAKSLFSSSDVVSVKRENTTVRESDEEHGYRSKNLCAERNRRKRIETRLLALRAVVPKISKMDKVSILGDALEYIAELKDKEKSLQDDLHQMEKDDPKVVEADLKFPISHETHECNKLMHHDAADSIVSAIMEPVQSKSNAPSTVQVEVNPLSEQEALIRILFRQNRGWFSSLTEALLSLSLTVINANITTSNGHALAVLVVKGSNAEICIQKLRDLLMNVVN